MGDKASTNLYEYIKCCQHAYQGLKDAKHNQMIVNKIEIQKAIAPMIKRSSVMTSTFSFSVASLTSFSAVSQIFCLFNINKTWLTNKEKKLLKQEGYYFHYKEKTDHWAEYIKK